MTTRTQRPRCDLVMKGGATSGVVYPPVIAELAEKYEFASIGGTSAGAIAAAVTAAAEHGRKRGHLNDFAPLNQLSSDLSEPGMLLRLFRTSAPSNLRPLLDTLLPLVSDPGASSSEPVPAGEQSPIPAPLRQIAPELIELLLPAKKADENPDDRLERTIRAVFRGLSEHHPQAYEAGAAAGGAAGVRMGQYLIYGAMILSALFAVPILLAGLTWLSGVAWAILSALLIGAAYIIGQRIGQLTLVLGGTASSLSNLVQLLLVAVPANLYGICTGRKQPDTPPEDPALTDWLHAQIAKMAGPTEHGGPLTFDDLHHEQIQLQMVTTNLSHGRPYILPFESDFILLFQRGDIERLFPDDVVEYMCQDRHLYPGWSLDSLNAGKSATSPQRFYMLPNSADLPVVVGMRMSLSFPLLISAVRLYTVSADCPRPEGMYQPQRQHLQENWFSDGGICSNFPIHFFDHWLPTHPTFGINLTGLPRDAFQTDVGVAAKGPQTGAVQPGYVSQIAPDAPSLPLPQTVKASQEKLLRETLLGGAKSGVDAPPLDPTARVLLPDAAQALPSLWQPVESLTRFIWSMFDTAMNYRDTTQLMLPSYKERAVQIRLDGTREGGLNLNMPKETLEKLQLYGREAGVLLRDRFDFDRHRWVRFRVLMGELERQMLSMQVPLSAMDSQSGVNFYEQLMQAARAAGFPFAEVAEPAWVTSADARLRALRALIGAWSAVEDADDPALQRRSSDLAQVLLALSDAWRQPDLTAEESQRRTAEIQALVQGWSGAAGDRPRYIGREVRFFKPVTSSGIDLRVTTKL
jgi:predicted acylesterase/phospholipase RssA